MQPTWVQIIVFPVLYTIMHIITGSTTIFDRMDVARDRIKATFMDQQNTFDFIIGFVHIFSKLLFSFGFQYSDDLWFCVVGAGTSGCVVANRLSKMFKVLLLDAGGEQHPGTYMPATSIGMLHRPSIDFYYKTVPQNRSSFAYEDRVRNCFICSCIHVDCYCVKDFKYDSLIFYFRDVRYRPVEVSVVKYFMNIQF